MVYVNNNLYTYLSNVYNSVGSTISADSAVESCPYPIFRKVIVINLHRLTV